MTLLTWYSQLVQCTVIYELTKKRKEVGDCRKKKKKEIEHLVSFAEHFIICDFDKHRQSNCVRHTAVGLFAWENSITEIDEMLVILDPLSVCLSHYADYTARVSCK